MIYIQSFEGGAISPVAKSSGAYSFSWSPQGSLIAFVLGNAEFVFATTELGNQAPSAIFVIPTAGGLPVRITDNSFVNVSPVWRKDGRRLLFVSDKEGSRDVYQIPLDQSGKPTQSAVRLTTNSNAMSIDLSSDDSLLSYSVFSLESNIWRILIPDNGPVSASRAEQITSGNRAIETVSVSRDALWLAYDSNEKGNQDIYRLRLPNGDPDQLTTDPSDDFVPSWSPDGKQIAFYSFRTGNRKIFVMSADGSLQIPVTQDTTFEAYPDWSPDGQELVFYSQKSGQSQLWIVSKSSGASGWGGPRPLTSDGGSFPRWSPDGEHIAYINTKGKELRVIAPTGGKPLTLVRADNQSMGSGPRFAVWSPDSRTIYYKGFDAFGQSSIWSIPASGGTPRLLVKFDDPLRPSNRTAFCTDGSRFYFTISKQESDIWLRKPNQKR